MVPVVRENMSRSMASGTEPENPISSDRSAPARKNPFGLTPSSVRSTPMVRLPENVASTLTPRLPAVGAGRAACLFPARRFLHAGAQPRRFGSATVWRRQNLRARQTLTPQREDPLVSFRVSAKPGNRLSKNPRGLHATGHVLLGRKALTPKQGL